MAPKLMSFRLRSSYLLLVVGLCFGTTLTFFTKTFSFNVIPTAFFSHTPSPPPLLHTMNDEELFWRASMVPRIHRKIHVPKLAFMFLTKGPLPFALLWDQFFKGHEGLYSIYVHPHPSFHHFVPQASVFHNRRVPSKAAEWGKPSMLDAERRLLANALLDFSNQRFILLSESCIPLFNFTTIYNYLINSDQINFISSYDDPRSFGRGRYNPQMSPLIKISDWRKGSQWFEVNRRLAVDIIADEKYYSLFKKYCRPPCYMDEHYIPTYVTKFWCKLNTNRSITWVDWSRGGSHPGQFGRKSITVEFLNKIRFGSECSYNANLTSVCFLFARKFLADSLEPLLQIAPKLMNF